MEINLCYVQYNSMNSLVKQDGIETRILLLRGHRVIIDRDLADLFDVKTKYLNRQVKRNIERFPGEFMFRLTKRERNKLVTNWHRFITLKHSSILPCAFTEHGVAMLATVLNSGVAIKASIRIIKAFIKLRKFISTHRLLSKKLKLLENKIDKHDKEIQSIFEAIRQLTSISYKSKKKIGFSID